MSCVQARIYPNLCVHCFIIGCATMRVFYLKKISREGILKGGVFLKYIFNDYAELDNKISYIVLLHYNILACNLSIISFKK